MALAGQSRAADSPAFIRPLPELHVQADLKTYLLQKDNFLRQHYLVGSDIWIEPHLVSFRDRFFFLTQFNVVPGMGRQQEDVVFDPIDINFSFGPLLEYRLPWLLIQAGGEHRCFHEIDRKDFKTVYWNMVQLAAGSLNYRPERFAAELQAASEWTLRSRLSWYVMGGYFLKDFFGARRSLVNYENRNVAEGRLQVRYAFWRWQHVYATVESRSRAGYWHDRVLQQQRGYWRQETELAANYSRENRGVMLFLNYILDDYPLYAGQPRFSKDRLLETGARFFF
jgi:hypothetical protein